MTADPLAEVLAKALQGIGLTDQPAKYDGSIHSWRCEYPDIYGPCCCFDEAVADIADAVRAFLAEHVAKPEVVEAAAEAIKYSQETAVYMTTTLKTDARAALAAALETLGGEPNE